MSSHPEEIEAGEIVVDEEEMSEEEMSEGGDDEDMMFEDEGADIAGLMTSLMATEEGDTVCTALVSISQQLQTQNKILIKMLSLMKN
jgi:hypothetical protein